MGEGVDVAVVDGGVQVAVGLGILGGTPEGAKVEAQKLDVPRAHGRTDVGAGRSRTSLEMTGENSYFWLPNRKPLFSKTRG